MTTYLESPDGLLLPPSRNGHRLSEAYHALTVDLLESRIAELETRLQTDGWARLDELGAREFGRATLDRITDLARVNYLKNPLIKRAVEVGALYVWGQDLSLDVPDEAVKAVVDRFWHDNRRTLTGQQASRLLEVELQVTGNVFLALFPNATTGSVLVRTVPMEEIREIVTNPDDRYTNWFYRREWTEKPLDGGNPVQRKALYPDWEIWPTEERAKLPAGMGNAETIGGVEVRWGSPMLQVKAGAFPHWRWGVSEVYAALDWARAYKEQLEDDATRSRALARFAWEITTKGGRQGVQSVKTKLGTTLGTGNGGETNPPPVAGSAAILGDGTAMRAISISNAMLPTDHSRPARLMASAALGLPDHFFDADVGNHATASTLDRPTELRFGERRQMWRDVLTNLVQWVIDRDIAATGGLLRATPTDDARELSLSWPDLLERSITDRIQAIVDAATLSGRTLAGTMPEDLVARMVMTELGVENVDDEIATLADERAARAERAADIARQMQPTPGPEADEEREAFIAALREVREAIRG